MHHTTPILTWLWQCAGRKGPLYPAFDVAAGVLLPAVIVYDVRVFQRRQGKYEGNQLGKAAKVDLGIRRQVDAVRNKGMIGLDNGSASLRGEVDVD